MIAILTNPAEPITSAAAELTDLIWGQDRRLLETIAPLTLRQSVSLDLSSVRRVDAAGVAALVALYRIAREAGHCFTVANAKPHVAETLALLGLDKILMSQNAVRKSQSGIHLRQAAA